MQHDGGGSDNGQGGTGPAAPWSLLANSGGLGGADPAAPSFYAKCGGPVGKGRAAPYGCMPGVPKVVGMVAKANSQAMDGQLTCHHHRLCIRLHDHP